MNQQQTGTNIHQITTPHNYEDFSEHANKQNVAKHKRKSFLKIKTILSSFILMLVLLGGAAGFFLTQFSSGDLRQQAYVGESCSASDPCPSTEECVNGKCASKPVAIPKDCSFAQHNKYACETLVKCVKCVDGQKVDASRQDCANQDPNSLCKPATNTNDCGWANHGQFACKTSTECVQCVNGAMVNVNKDYCAAPCGNNTSGPQPGASCTEVKSETCTKNGKTGTKSCTYTKRSNESPFACNLNPSCGECIVPAQPGASCTEVKSETCTKNGKTGTKSCTYTKRSSESPYACNLNPSCGECIVPGGGYPPTTCGGKDQACCSGTTKCNTGLTCTNNTCTTPPTICGGKDQACCLGATKCGTGLTCTNNFCTISPTTCGGKDQACCSGATKCSNGLTCTNNFCTISPPVTPSCGASGQACCAGTTKCNTGLTCTNNTCTTPPTEQKWSCINGECKQSVSGTYTSASACTAACEKPPVTPSCGASGQACCAGTTKCSTGLTCTNNRCTISLICGASGQACCAGTTKCNTGLICMYNTCTTPPPTCGLRGQVCCAGATKCSTGLTCTNNTCTTPPTTCGGKDQACCDGTIQCDFSMGLVCGTGNKCEKFVLWQNDCDSQTSEPYCSGNNIVVTCLSDQWYEVACGTRCLEGVCLSSEEADELQQLYNEATTTVQNSSVENIINDNTLNILYITGLL